MKAGVRRTMGQIAFITFVINRIEHSLPLQLDNLVKVACSGCIQDGNPEQPLRTLGCEGQAITCFVYVPQPQVDPTTNCTRVGCSSGGTSAKEQRVHPHHIFCLLQSEAIFHQDIDSEQLLHLHVLWASARKTTGNHVCVCFVVGGCRHSDQRGGQL